MLSHVGFQVGAPELALAAKSFSVVFEILQIWRCVEFHAEIPKVKHWTSLISSCLIAKSLRVSEKFEFCGVRLGGVAKLVT